MCINWGSSNPPGEHKYLNDPEHVGNCTNKLKFFRDVIKDTRTPEWTDDDRVAAEWFEDGDVVVARTKLQGHSGEGIVVVDPATWDITKEGPKAPLYTKYVKKKDEYRIHIFDGNVIFEQRKAKRHDVEEVDYKIRNHAGGFIYAHKDIEVPDDVITQAKLAMTESRLDFGAVDVIYNSREDKAYVLEINTAPGLEGTTLEKYTEAVEKYCIDRGIKV